MTRHASALIMNRRLGVVCLAVALTATLNSTAVAQQVQDTAAPVADQAAQTPAPDAAAAAAAKAKAALAWHGTINFGVTVANGVEAQRGFQLSATIKKQFADHAVFVANGARQYQKVTFPTQGILNDRTSASIGLDMDPTKNTVFMARSMYLRDPLMYVNSRFEQLVGYGYQWVDAKKKREFQLVPGLSFFKQDLAYSDNVGWESAWGFYEKFEGEISPTWSFSNSFRFRHNFKNFNRSVEAIAALQGQITKPLSLQIEYQWNHESVVPEGFPQFLSELSVGLRLHF